jgi:hypothetical protein
MAFVSFPGSAALLLKTTLPLWTYVSTSSPPTATKTDRRSGIETLFRLPRLTARRRATYARSLDSGFARLGISPAS